MFVGKDVATALGYAKPENAIATHVDADDKTTTLIQGTGSNYKTKVVLINESGLYSLILSSKLPQAKAFKRWVTSEVLPQIRLTGDYIPIMFSTWIEGVIMVELRRPSRRRWRGGRWRRSGGRRRRGCPSRRSGCGG